MRQTIGVGIIARNAEKSIGECIQSFAEYVDDIVVVLAGASQDETASVALAASPKVRTFDFEWIDDFASARNYSFSKLNTDYYFWVDSDDIVTGAENLPKLAAEMPDDVGALWFPYKYATDDYGNITTLYERERLLKASFGWLWKGRLHETVSPQKKCQYARTDDVMIDHKHRGHGGDRGVRNFHILNIMLKEDPTDKRIWLYLGHQNFAAQNFMDAAHRYLQFGSDKGATPIERYQALCYASKALREMGDPQAIDAALMAMELYPQYRDGYLELAHSYCKQKEYAKALHWAHISEDKGAIIDPPHIIFFNPMDATFNKYVLEGECYCRLQRYDRAIEKLEQAYAVAPVESIKQNIAYIQESITRDKVEEAIKIITGHLLSMKQMVNLKHILEITPFWLRDSDLYNQLRNGIERDSANLGNLQSLDPYGDDKVIIDISNDLEPEQTLREAEEKYNEITVVCTNPIEGREQIRAMSRYDMEKLIMSKGGRHIIDLQQTGDHIFCKYDKKLPDNMAVRIYLGQGLETWNPATIEDIGCGGSETAAAMVAKRFAEQGCQPLLYAMDDQVWDGVIYRHHEKYTPDNISSHLFISSRVPEVFDAKIASIQKWLWFHDIHRGARLTPERASQIDALLLLSKWHVNFTKATYPFLKDAEVIDLDNQPLTFNDCEAPDVFYEDGMCYRLPKIAIIGNGINAERFEEVTEERVPYRFIWCSSPDRGLEQVFQLWPLIKEQMPESELKIFYGWEYYDSMLWVPQYRDFKQKLLKLGRQPGIQWCGRVGQNQIAKELMKADVMLYPPPHDFRETYGIAFLEAQAAGCLCFYRQNGALGETIGDRGIPLALDIKPSEIVNKIYTTLGDRNQCDIIRNKAREYALARTWQSQADKMLYLYEVLNNAKN